MYWDGKVTILCNNSGQKMDGYEHVTVLAGFRVVKYPLLAEIPIYYLLGPTLFSYSAGLHV